MVMAPAHAGMGLAAGLAAAHFLPPVFTHPEPAGVQLVFGLLTAGAAILPDLDHPQATAARSLGLLSQMPALAVNRLSGLVYRATRTDRDSDRNGRHRGITHTVPGAVLFAVLAAAAITCWGRGGLAGVTFVLFLFALRALPPVHRIGTDLLVAAGLSWAVLVLLPGSGVTDGTAPAWLGAAVLLGCLVHDLGDLPTESGCALLWPVPLRGQRWYPVSLPTLLRFRAANAFANALILAASVAVSGWVGWLLLRPHLPAVLSAVPTR